MDKFERFVFLCKAGTKYPNNAPIEYPAITSVGKWRPPLMRQNATAAGIEAETPQTNGFHLESGK